MRLSDLHRFSVAPMMDWTDRHCRTFMRLLSKRAVLYTEMLHAEAVVRGKQQQLLGFPAMQNPVVLQLGGAQPDRLAKAAKIGESFGYDEINLNVGCPSDRVQSGKFGACLMLDPQHVSELVAAMRSAVSIPVSVKCRIGVDQQDAEEDFSTFIDKVSEAGCRHFIVHARKAWLQGLSPKENRDVPPLDYERVYRLAARRSDLEISINGGVEDLASCATHLKHVDGVMLGRAAYHNPYLLSEVDQQIYASDHPQVTRRQVVEKMLPYIEAELQAGTRLSSITRHMMGLYMGQPGARHWRRHLSLEACKSGAGGEVVLQAMELVEKQRQEAACRV